jgi:serine/threonine protein kinase
LPTKPQEIEFQIINGTGYRTAKEIQQQESIVNDVSPQNNFSPDKKLVLALQMAEAIADLHGFKNGVIVHGDIQLCQYLFNRDGQLKLNDFNRAELMLWDTEKQEYCRFKSGLVYGNYRSPEEDEDEPLNEQIDVFSLGKYPEFCVSIWTLNRCLNFFPVLSCFYVYIGCNAQTTYNL